MIAVGMIINRKIIKYCKNYLGSLLLLFFLKKIHVFLDKRHVNTNVRNPNRIGYHTEAAAYLWIPIWTVFRRCTWAPCSSWSSPPSAWWRTKSGTGAHDQRGRATTTGAVRPAAAATATAAATGPARFPRNKHPAPTVYLLIRSAHFLHLFALCVALSRSDEQMNLLRHLT